MDVDSRRWTNPRVLNRKAIEISLGGAGGRGAGFSSKIRSDKPSLGQPGPDFSESLVLPKLSPNVYWPILSDQKWS